MFPSIILFPLCSNITFTFLSYCLPTILVSYPLFSTLFNKLISPFHLPTESRNSTIGLLHHSTPYIIEIHAFSPGDIMFTYRNEIVIKWVPYILVYSIYYAMEFVEMRSNCRMSSNLFWVSGRYLQISMWIRWKPQKG